MRNTMEEKFISILSKISFFEKEDITFELTLFDDLAISSIMLVEMITSFEKEFKIELERDMGQIVTFTTVGQLYEFILNKKDKIDNM